MQPPAGSSNCAHQQVSFLLFPNKQLFPLIRFLPLLQVSRLLHLQKRESVTGCKRYGKLERSILLLLKKNKSLKRRQIGLKDLPRHCNALNPHQVLKIPFDLWNQNLPKPWEKSILSGSLIR